jgi:Predicted transcriptional regulators
MIGHISNNKFGKMRMPHILILISVRNQRKYGYEILKDLRDVSDGLWEPKTGVIYPLLKKMQENDLLNSEMSDGKEYYGLTDAGRNALREILPKMSSMLMMAARYTTVIDEVMKDMSIEPSDLNDIFDRETKGDLSHLIEVRDHLKWKLAKVEESIEKYKEE